MKYGCVASGPFVVTVQPFTERCQSSATPSQSAAEDASPLTRARSAAAARPAISAAIVEGEKPPCSSQRSDPNAGPREIRKFAAGLMWFAYSAASVSPSCCAIRIGYATSSSCVPNESGAGLPLTRLFRGIDPSGSCWRSKRKSVAARAVARSPAATRPVQVS